MHFLKVFLLLSLSIYLTEGKVKLVLTNASANKILLRGSQDTQQHSSSTTYINLVEGTNDIYATCQSICSDQGKILYYSEETEFPQYGKMFRCQCDDHYTNWYNYNDMSELCLDALLGDTLFNDYFNLLGFDVSDCQCDSLKALLSKLIATV